MIKLRCTSWGQLDAIYRRDLMRSAVFLKTKKPPPLGTSVRINLTLPSHAALLTGVHPRDTGVVGNVDRLADQALTLAELTPAAGGIGLRELWSHDRP